MIAGRRRRIPRKEKKGEERKGRDGGPQTERRALLWSLLSREREFPGEIAQFDVPLLLELDVVTDLTRG